MGRKRSIGQETIMRENRRKRMQAVQRLNEWHYCPVCRKKSIETDFVSNGKGGVIIEETMYLGKLIKVHLACSICRSCQRKKVVYLLPGEELIDLYHMLHDEIRSEVIWAELFEWLESDLPESKSDRAKRLREAEESKVEKWKTEKIDIPEPSVVE